MVRALRWRREQQQQQTTSSSDDAPERADGEFARQYRQCASAVAAVLLSLCKNVATLHLGGVRAGSPLASYLAANNYAVAQPGSQERGLQRLRHVEINPGGSYYDRANYDRVEFVDVFRYFHRLPAVESVRLVGVMEYQSTSELFPPGSSAAIRRLHIDHADIGSDMLGTLIRIPARLDELRLSLGGLWHTDGGTPYVDARVVGKSLLEHRATLRMLDLDIDLGVSHASPYDDGDSERYDRMVRREEERSEHFRMDRELSDQQHHPPAPAAAERPARHTALRWHRRLAA